MSELSEAVVRLVLERGHERRDEAFELSAGLTSRDYVDAKRAMAGGAELRTVAEAVVEVAADAGVAFDAVGGLTMGSDPIAHAVAVVADTRWFTVRKQSKQHGKQQRIEGAQLTASTRVLLVEDVVTTGGSIVQALDAVEATGAEVVLAVTLVDRGDFAAPELERRGVPYRPLATYRDLGIDPVTRET